MWKQRAASRRLPFQLIAQRLGIDGYEKKIARPSEMAPRGLLDLIARGKMNESVRTVDRRTGEEPRGFRRTPEYGRGNFIDHGDHLSTCFSDGIGARIGEQAV